MCGIASTPYNDFNRRRRLPAAISPFSSCPAAGRRRLPGARARTGGLPDQIACFARSAAIVASS